MTSKNTTPDEIKEQIKRRLNDLPLYETIYGFDDSDIINLIIEYREEGIKLGKEQAFEQFELTTKYGKSIREAIQYGEKKAQKKNIEWLENLLITNWEVEKVKERIKELKKAVSKNE